MTIFYRLTAVFCLLAGGALAWQHPLWPLLALAGFYIACIVIAWQPGIWLFVVPATLPLLNFSPWTGWLIFDEFDLLLLGTLTGACARMAWDLRAPVRPTSAYSGDVQTPQVDAVATKPSKRIGVLLALMAVFAVIALLRGFATAGGFDLPSTPGFGHYIEQAYGDPMNSVRVFKSLGFSLLFLPLLRHEMQTPALQTRACRLFGAGMVAGLSLVVLVVAWERIAYPGLLNFSTHYRTTALFWEMHVGGAAIDAYLAMAAPFVAWALGRSGRLLRWLPLALLAVLVCYTGLTTFSRGVYLALALPLVLLAGGAWARKSGFNWRELLNTSWQRLRHGGWRTKAGLLLGAVLLLEVVGVVGGGTFMRERLANTETDLASRIVHWRRGLSLLHTPADWVFGRGLGRLPAEYANIGSETEFPGAVHLATDTTDDSNANRFVSVSGPHTNEDLGGFYALTQRVDVIAPGNYRVQMRVRVNQNTDMILKICEKHLLYEGLCQARWIRLRPAAQGWQTIAVALSGEELTGAIELIPRFGVFSIFVVNAGGQADIRGVKLIGPNHKDMLANGDFSHGLAQWFPSAGGYYLPWHIDNLYLEVLIERGVAGLLLSGCLVMAALGHLIFGVGPRRPMAAYLAASIGGALLIGLISSVMDVPRVAFLLYLLVFFSVHLTRKPT